MRVPNMKSHWAERLVARERFSAAPSARSQRAIRRILLTVRNQSMRTLVTIAVVLSSPATLLAQAATLSDTTRSYVSVSISSTPSVTGSQPVATTAEQARRVVDYWADEGVNWFGEGLPTTRALMGEVIQEAHKRGLKVSGHICAVTHREAVALGI